MQTFIVRVRDGAGNLRWVTVLGTSAEDARSRVTKSTPGWTAQEVFQDFEDAQSTDSTLEGKSINDIRYFGSLPPAEAGGAGDMGGGGGGAEPFDPDALAPPGVGQQTVAADTLPFQKSQFLRGLGDRGLGTSGIAGKQRREAFDPTFNRFLFENYFNTPGFDPTNPEAVDQPRFAEFARTSPLFGRGANQQALGQFQQAVDTSRGLNPLGTGFDALAAGQQDILNPQSAGQAGILSSLANQAARARYGVGAEFLGNRDFGAEFFGQGRNTGAQSFAEFLNSKIFGG